MVGKRSGLGFSMVIVSPAASTAETASVIVSSQPEIDAAFSQERRSSAERKFKENFRGREAQAFTQSAEFAAKLTVPVIILQAPFESIWIVFHEFLKKIDKLGQENWQRLAFAKLSLGLWIRAQDHRLDPLEVIFLNSTDFRRPRQHHQLVDGHNGQDSCFVTPNPWGQGGCRWRGWPGSPGCPSFPSAEGTRREDAPDLLCELHHSRCRFSNS